MSSQEDGSSSGPTPGGPAGRGRRPVRSLVIPAASLALGCGIGYLTYLSQHDVAAAMSAGLLALMSGATMLLETFPK